MLRITVDVNGRPISHLFVHNVGPIDSKPGVWQYHAGLYDDTRPDRSVLGIEGLYHVRENGWIPLARILLSVLQEEGV